MTPKEVETRKGLLTYVLQRDGEMDQEKTEWGGGDREDWVSFGEWGDSGERKAGALEVVDTPVRELLLHDGEDVLL